LIDNSLNTIQYSELTNIITGFYKDFGKVVIKKFPLQAKILFEHELKILEKLKGNELFPNIIDYHKEDEYYIIIMEYIDGIPIKNHKFNSKNFIKIFLQIAEAIEILHSYGIVHMDIKPSNIIITKDEKIKIIDFSISSTDNKILGGSIPYMAPEALGYTDYQISNATDLYSLGITFYELLTDKLPFEASDKTALIKKIISEEPPPIERNDIPETLKKIVYKLIDKDPYKRYNQASALVYDLSLLDNDTEPKIGEKDFIGDIKYRFELNFKKYDNIIKDFLNNKEENLAVIGPKLSGKTLLLKYISNKNKSIFIRLVKTDKEGEAIKSIFNNFSIHFGTKKLLEFIDKDTGKMIIDFLPDGIKEEFDLTIENKNNEAIPYYLLKAIIPLLNFLNENGYILIIDDIEKIDNLSLTLLTSKIPIKIVFSSSEEINNEINRNIKYKKLLLEPASYEMIEEIVNNLLYSKINKNKLEEICKKFEESGLYISEIIEAIKFLIAEKSIKYNINKKEWEIIDNEKIKKVKSLFLEKIKNILSSLKNQEKYVLFLIIIFNEIFENDISYILGFDAKDIIIKLVKEGLIEKEKYKIKINPKISSLILNEVSIDEEFYNKILESSLKLFEKYPIPVLEILIKTKNDLFDEYFLKISDKLYENQNYSHIIKFLPLIKDNNNFLTSTFKYIPSIISVKSYEIIDIVTRLEDIDKNFKLTLKEKISAYFIISRYFFLKNNYPKIEKYLNFINENINCIKDENELYSIYVLLFGTTYFKGDIKLAKQYGEKALKYREKIINDQDVYIVSLLSATQAFLGDKKGIETSKRVIKEGISIASMSMTGIFFHFAGYTLSYLGHPEEGLEFSKEARSIGIELNNPLITYASSASIAKGFIMNNMLAEAIKVIEEAIDISKKYIIMVGLDFLYNEYLEALFILKEKDKFEQGFIYLESLKNFLINSKWYQVIYYKNKGILEIFKSELKDAEESLNKAYNLSKDFLIEHAKIAGLLHYVYINIGEYTLARTYLNESESIFNQYDNFEEYKKNFIFRSLEFYSTQTSYSVSIKDELTFDSIINSIASLSTINNPKKMILRFIDILFEILGAKRIKLDITISGKRYYIIIDNNFNQIEDFTEKNILEKAINKHIPLIFKETEKDKSVLIFPLKKSNQIIGYIYLSNPNIPGLFKEKDLKIIRTLSNQLLILLENAILFKKEIEAKKKIEGIMKSFKLFVPKQFLDVIASEGVEKISLGTSKKIEASILFCDIRDFTTISEKMDSLEVIKFLNDYMKEIASLIEENSGFIDKFIGDAILGIFDCYETDKVIDTAIKMCKKVKIFSKEINKKIDIGIGIGINSAKVTIGTIGTYTRMDSTVIGDGVNLASRLEGLTKMYHVPIVVSDYTIKRLKNQNINYREIDSVIVKGKEKPVVIYEVFEWEDKDKIELKKSYNSQLLMGITLYKIMDFNNALEYFKTCKEINSSDSIVDLYIKRCNYYIKNPPPPDWIGAIKLENK